MIPTSHGELHALVTGAGHDWFHAGPFDLNLVGIRVLPGAPNRFDDWLCVAYLDDYGPRFERFPATLDPGRDWLVDKANTNGSFIVAPGQYPGVYARGLHKGKTPCLVPVGDLKGWRDRNGDNVADRTGPLSTATPLSGIQIHGRGRNTAPAGVDRYSDACTVTAYEVDLQRLLALLEAQAERGFGSRVTYTVLEVAA